MKNNMMANFWMDRLSFWLAMEESLLKEIHISLCQRHIDMWRTGIYSVSVD